MRDSTFELGLRHLITKNANTVYEKGEEKGMNVRCSKRGSLLGIEIYSPSSECLIEYVDIPEHRSTEHRVLCGISRPAVLLHLAAPNMADKRDREGWKIQSEIGKVSNRNLQHCDTSCSDNSKSHFKSNQISLFTVLDHFLWLRHNCGMLYLRIFRSCK